MLTSTLIIATVLIACYSYIKWAFGFWKRANVPYVEPSMPFGTSENPFGRNEYIGFRIKKRYDEFKAQGHKHGGLYFFTNPVYLPVHVDYIRNVMAKDFRYFTDRGVYCNEKCDPLTGNLFFLNGDRWKTVRTKLTPTFTSSKIKMMFPTLVQCAENLEKAVRSFCVRKVEFDVKDISSCYTMDVIGSCAFGLDIDSFANPHNEFAKHGDSFFSSLTQMKSPSIIISLAAPKLARLLNVQTIPEDITNFFLKLVKDTVDYREKNKIYRKDFMQIMIDLKDVDGGFSIREMAANSFSFFVAGYETSSTTISFCLYEIAKDQEIQKAVRAEIMAGLEKQLTYEVVMSMTYLDQVIDETLRKYPPVALMTRVCTEDYPLDVSRNIVIKKGTKVAIPIYAVHHDPEYYPEPEKFDPERFSEEAVSNRPAFAYMPFGAGPRVCTGLRMGLLQTKVGLVTLLKSFQFSVNARTVEPLEFQSKNFALKSKDGIWLDAFALNDSNEIRCG
ncbi:hypothetical protein FQR65_LT12419 [Abscondita terminalis]|nr:hypothetical protein FQR65_LT12419 [Abscondita terminalis]